MSYSRSFQILEYRLDDYCNGEPVEVYKQSSKAWIDSRKRRGLINGENLELWGIQQKEDNINIDYEGFDNNEYSLYEVLNDTLC